MIALAAFAALLLPLGALAQSHPLNDTAQTTCYDADASTGTVAPATPNPVVAGFENQDCVRGAAAADALGVLVKTGASTAHGRDYSKIANDGSALPASATLGSAPGDWACTRDNVTGLIWEVKVNAAAQLRHFNHTYTWFDSDTSRNGGNSGTVGTATTCSSTLPNCNSTALRDAVNALPGGLCGAIDWRVPTPQELQSLLHYGLTDGPLIDQTWFPNTASASYWTDQTQASGATGVVEVSFIVGDVPFTTKNSNRHVRLVRGEP
jgi:hypothetical protein